MAELDTNCRNCGAPLLEIRATSAAHDPELIDIVVECPECHYTLNAFISLGEMTEVQPGSKEPENG